MKCPPANGGLNPSPKVRSGTYGGGPMRWMPRVRHRRDVKCKYIRAPVGRIFDVFRPSRRAARARPEHAQPVDRAARGRGSGLGRDGTAPGGRVAAEDGRRGRLRRAWHVLRSGNLCRRTTRRRGRPVVTLCRAVNGARRVEHGGTRGHNAQKDGHGRRGQCCAASVVIWAQGGRARCAAAPRRGAR